MPPSHALTPTLDVAFESAGPKNGKPVMLLHGWPDDIHAWDKVLPILHRSGFRTIAPYLRGFGPTRFRSARTMRSGQLAALGQDAIDLAHALGFRPLSIVGHDWGARAAYIAAALAPERISHCVAISVGWGTNDPRQPLPLNQVRNYWYHWYMALERGARLVREDGKALARFAWQTWGPTGWFTESEFETTAKSFENPDWADVVLHSYRHRWQLADSDPAYAALEARLNPTPTISVPTLVLHGGADACNEPTTSANRERLFSGSYRRVVLDGVGHFPSREAPDEVGAAIAAFLVQPSR